MDDSEQQPPGGGAGRPRSVAAGFGPGGNERLIEVVASIYAGDDAFSKYFGRVGDLMDRSWHLRPDDTVEDALRFLDQRRGRDVPVVGAGDDEEGLGFVSSRALARAMPPRAGDRLEATVRATPLRELVDARRPRVAIETDLGEAVRLMIDGGVDALIVTDGRGAFAGVLNSLTVARCYIRMGVLRSVSRLLRGDTTEVELSLLDLSALGKASDLMTTLKVETLHPTSTVRDAVGLFRTHRFRHLPIVERNGSLAGFVSDCDVLRQLPARPRAPSASVGGDPRAHLYDTDPDDPATTVALGRTLSSFMATEVVRVHPRTPILQIIDAFDRHRISAVPVVTGHQDAVSGIVTTVDVLKAVQRGEAGDRAA